MLNVTECVICGKPIDRIERGFVAPFLAQRIWNRSSFAAEYMHCDQCEFGFFNPRLEPPEEFRLYRGYRNANYLETRHATEPWYTANLNDSLSDPQVMQARCRKLHEIFSRQLPPAGPVSVLDFGGDRGELIRNLFPKADNCVYDISTVTPVSGVRSLSLAECQQQHFDLIICSNVLEHVAQPVQVLREIESVAEKGTLVFLEVPVESNSSWQTIVKRVVQEAILLAIRPSLALSLLRFRSMNVMHEHLNFFSLRSLQRLGASLESPEIASGVYSPFVRTASATAWILLRRP